MKRVREVGEIVAIVLVVAFVALMAYGLVTLPPTIATHFSGSTPDAHGPKSSLLLLVAPALVFYVILSVVAFVPVDRMNLPTKVTPENAVAVGEAVRAMLAWLKATGMLTVLGILYAMITSAGGVLSPFASMAGAFVVPLLVVIVVFMVAIRRAGGA